MLKRFAQCLLPTPDKMAWVDGHVTSVRLSTLQKALYFSFSGPRCIKEIVQLPFTLIQNILKSPPPKKEPSSLRAQEENDLFSALPGHFGFADSLFQTCGMGTKASPTLLKSRSNWDKWLNPQRIENTENGDYSKFFINIDNPAPFIALLQKMGVTAHRFSMEWSVIEPEKGQYDPKAIQYYRNFILKLKEAHIEPYVTLHHFTLPEWFEKREGLIAPHREIYLYNMLWI